MQSSAPVQDRSSGCSIRLPEDPKNSSGIPGQLVTTAGSIKGIFRQSYMKVKGILSPAKDTVIQEHFLDEKVRVLDPDFLLCVKYAWAVLAYKKVFEKESASGSPGPDNGYFETAQLLFEQIEMLGRKFGLLNEGNRPEYYGFLENMFPGMPRLTRCWYPAIIYFICLRMRSQKGKLSPDFWMVSVGPSKDTECAALYLLIHCDNMIKLLTAGNEAQFRKTFYEYERAWSQFYQELKRESKEYSYNWCPDLSIELLMSRFSSNKDYLPKAEGAQKIAWEFEADSKQILQAIEMHPKKLPDTLENNRAQAIALKVIKAASTTLDLVAGCFVRDVKILKL